MSINHSRLTQSINAILGNQSVDQSMRQSGNQSTAQRIVTRRAIFRVKPFLGVRCAVRFPMLSCSHICSHMLELLAWLRFALFTYLLTHAACLSCLRAWLRFARGNGNVGGCVIGSASGSASGSATGSASARGRRNADPLHW